MLLFSAIFFLLGCWPEKSIQQHWRFALEEISGSIQDQYAQEFKKRVENASDGRIKVSVYPYGTLGSSDQITELVATGAVQFAMSSPGFLGKLVPELQVFLLPFILPEEMERLKPILTEGKTLKNILRPLYEEKGLKLFTLYPEGWQVWTANREIRTPKDFEGFRMRVMTTPLLLELFKAYSATPVGLPYSEVYSGLQLKMIDGQVNPVFAVEEMSFYEVSDYLIRPRATQFITSVVTSQRFYRALSDEDKKLVQEVIKNLQGYIFEAQNRVNKERLDIILSKRPDIKIIELDDNERKLFRDRSVKAREKYLEIGGKQARAVLKGLSAEAKRSE